MDILGLDYQKKLLVCHVIRKILTFHKLLLKQSNVDVNVQNNEGNTAWIGAIGNGYERIVKMLLKRPDINVNLHDKQGGTVLTSFTFFSKFNSFQGASNPEKLMILMSNLLCNNIDPIQQLRIIELLLK